MNKVFFVLLIIFFSGCSLFQNKVILESYVDYSSGKGDLTNYKFFIEKGEKYNNNKFSYMGLEDQKYYLYLKELLQKTYTVVNYKNNADIYLTLIIKEETKKTPYRCPIYGNVGSPEISVINTGGTSIVKTKNSYDYGIVGYRTCQRENFNINIMLVGKNENGEEKLKTFVDLNLNNTDNLKGNKEYYIQSSIKKIIENFDKNLNGKVEIELEE